MSNATIPRMGRPKKSEPTEQLRLPTSVAKLIRRIALHRGMDPGDYVAARFADLLDQDRREMLADLQREDVAKPKKK